VLAGASISILEARNRLAALPDELGGDQESGAVAVTRQGKPVLAIMAWDLYESLVESLEVLGDACLTADVRAGLRQLERGEGIRWEQAKEKLRL
jgi:PHD/YefM family antitoxin component YafN of YafNO toxin-antitoxin module